MNRITGPTQAELDDIESTDAAEDLRRQLPKQLDLQFDMARGHDAPPENAAYGRPKIVHRLKNQQAMPRDEAERILAERGIEYEELFYTARYWCAVVFE